MDSKHARFIIFIERLQESPAAQTFAEAFQQIADLLIQVENELTDIPYNPTAWETDGRMYPPQMDSERNVDGHVQVRRFRSRAHNTFIGENGSIEIQDVKTGTIILTKVGADGRSLWHQ